ncbi:MAG TPA: response regulator, partial [Nitrospirae bacterium]|nr:response regulator [Nitrospirota bacterium]
MDVFNRPDGVEDSKKTANPSESENNTILVAEDNKETSYFIKVVLEKSGYKVMISADGEDAIKRFMGNKDKIRLLILDVMMPGKNGKEVYDEIVKMSPDIKVIFVSGFTADIIHEEEICKEGQGYLKKPFLAKDL